MKPLDKQIVELTIKGKTQKAIAIELARPADTVHDRLYRLKQAYQVNSLPSLIAVMYERGVIKNYTVRQHETEIIKN